MSSPLEANLSIRDISNLNNLLPRLLSIDRAIEENQRMFMKGVHIYNNCSASAVVAVGHLSG